MTTPTPQGLFASLDWQVIAYAASMSAVSSFFSLLRARNNQISAGLPVSSWMTIFPDVALGTLVGTVAALAIPQWFKPLNTYVGILLIAGVGGVLGPKITDSLSQNGVGVLLDYLGSGAGRLSKAIAAKKGDDNGGKDNDPT